MVTTLLLNKKILGLGLRDLDPTKTIYVRNRFTTAMDSRFRNFMRFIVKSVRDNDCFALNSKPINLQLGSAEALGERAFEFRRSADKMAAFSAWMQEMINKEILETMYVFQEGRTGLWSDVFVMSAFQRGLSQARLDLKRSGVDVEPYTPEMLARALRLPINAERLELIYTRVYTDLKGVSDAMATQISRVLAQGLAENITPEEMALRMTKVVKDIGINRARMIARTETVYAVNSAYLREYERTEQEIGTEIKVMWWTARDEKVCAVCGPRHGQIYTRDEAIKLIVPHPNCRCGLLPYIEKGGNA